METANAVNQVKAKAPVQLSGSVLKAFFDGSDAEKTEQKVAGLEKSRLAYLRNLFVVSDLTTTKAATKDYVKDVEKDSGWNKKADKRPPRAVLVARSRASEVKALYGALRFGGLTLDGMGYHKAIAKAREVLAEKAIKWDGVPIPDAAAKAKIQAVKLTKAKRAALEKAAEMLAAEKGRTLTEAEEEALWKSQGQIYERLTAFQIALKLVEKYGKVRIEQIVACVPQAIQQHEAEQQRERETQITPQPEQHSEPANSEPVTDEASGAVSGESLDFSAQKAA